MRDRRTDRLLDLCIYRPHNNTHTHTQDGSLNPDRKKVVWSQKVSPQNRDKRAVEERKRKMLDMRKCVF